jgi:thiol-disulfide isomerase/thioredoxin
VNKIYTKQELDAELAKSKNTIVLFYATWCPYCMRFEPFFNQKVAQHGFENVVHVLLDDYDNPLWDDYDISSVPTVILFEGMQVNRRLDGHLGRGLKEDELVKWLNELKK